MCLELSTMPPTMGSVKLSWTRDCQMLKENDGLPPNRISAAGCPKMPRCPPAATGISTMDWLVKPQAMG